jgi:hypothetical protein
MDVIVITGIGGMGLACARRLGTGRRMKLLAFGTSPFPADEPRAERTGVYATGIVARSAEHDIALYFTGNQHAGENLARVLRERAAALPPPIQMCDALSHNTAELNHVDPFDYLVQIQRHADALTANPASWMPWNDRDMLPVCSSGADPPS